MPEVTIQIGGRSFQVACQDGEESYLQAAAKLLDDEAQVLVRQIGRIPESRLLLMAGLMLADKTAGLEDKLREAEARLADREREIAGRPDGEGDAPSEEDARLREAEARIAAQEAELEELRARPDPGEAEATAARLEEAEQRIAAQEAELEELRARPAPEPEQVEVIPDHVSELLAALAMRAETLAETVEAHLARPEAEGADAAGEESEAQGAQGAPTDG